MDRNNIVGLIPASGISARLGGLPCSKEIMPVGIDDQGKVKVISEYLLQQFQVAGIKKVYFIIRKGKWDIPNYFGDGSKWGMHFSYCIMNLPHGVPFTLAQAFPFIEEDIVVTGFPDMILKPDDMTKQVVDALINTKADLVMSLMPIENKSKWDMIDLDDEGNIRQIVIKPPQTDLKYGWVNTAWSPRITKYFKQLLNEIIDKDEFATTDPISGKQREIYPGDLMQKAIDNGYKVKGVVIDQGECLDIGTIDDMRQIFR